MEKVSEIFGEAQRHMAVHKSSVKKLQAHLKDVSEAEREDIFQVILRGFVDQYLTVAKKETAVERVIKFFCDFLSDCSTNEDDKMFRSGIEHLLTRSLAADKTVRYRAMQSLAMIISSLDGDAEISNDLWENIITTCTPRLRDKAPNVRMWALKALNRLQNPENEEDKLLQEFTRLMNTDTAVAVRVAAVDNISPCKQTLGAIVARVRDIKPEVRAAALERLTTHVDVRSFSPSQRATITVFGLNDRDESCKSAAVALVQK